MQRRNFTARIYNTAKKEVKYVLLTWINNGKLRAEKVIFRGEIDAKEVIDGKYCLAISSFAGSIRLKLFTSNGGKEEKVITVPLNYKVLGLSTKV